MFSKRSQLEAKQNGSRSDPMRTRVHLSLSKFSEGCVCCLLERTYDWREAMSPGGAISVKGGKTCMGAFKFTCSCIHNANGYTILLEGVYFSEKKKKLWLSIHSDTHIFCGITLKCFSLIASRRVRRCCVIL